ncbi:unnamed protein product [Diplocarpon coronariae]|nr:hypothetical protein JHW43_001616 [Diplocarpon mali]
MHRDLSELGPPEHNNLDDVTSVIPTVTYLLMLKLARSPDRGIGGEQCPSFVSRHVLDDACTLNIASGLAETGTVVADGDAAHHSRHAQGGFHENSELILYLGWFLWQMGLI